MKNRIAFYTFGCRLNQSETTTIERSFETNGYQIVEFNDNPDIVVINTCTVTENGDADTKSLVNKINRVSPYARIALIGCQAQIQKEKLAKLPNVSWVVGNARKMELLSIIRELDAPSEPQVIMPTFSRESFTMPIAGIDRKHRRANLKIQDGCDFFCSFCEIPFARGRARSRVFADILIEAKTLVASEHQELVLTGINIGTYHDSGKTIYDVIDSLEHLDGLKRIRISSIEPTTIPENLISKMSRANSKLCRHLHIPLQSGSDDILKKMGRKYTVKEFSDFLVKAYRQIPGICLGTDIIVGFPGESEKNFKQTCEVLRELPLSYIHVFSYSARYVAKSRKFPDPVPGETIEHRSLILRELSDRKRHVFFENSLATTQSVLFENYKDGLWFGTTDNFIKVGAPSQNNLKNQIHTVCLMHIEKNFIRGEKVIQ